MESVPQNNDSNTTDVLNLSFPTKRLKRSLVICLLLLATGLRMIYGYDLIKNPLEESQRIEFIKRFSVQPGKINLPMGNAVSQHTVLSAYITALGYWLSGGSVYGIRIIYVLLSVFGLLGLFYLTRELFGYRAAIVALFLGTVDHHLISYAPDFSEPVYLCLVPWLILSVYRAVQLERANYWIIIGVIGGLGYMCSEIFLLLALPIVLTILFSGKASTVFKTPRFYIAWLVFFLIILPSLVWNYNHQFVNIVRHTERKRARR